jgi:hypothetical protein
MSHQPYDNWLYDEAELSNEQAHALQVHLQECRQCSEQYQAWKAVNAQFRSVQVESPLSGFSQRWRASLAERRLRQQARQIRQFFLVLLGAALFTLLLLVITLLVTTSPLNLLVSAYQSLIRLVIQGNHIQHVFLPLLGSLPPVIPIAAWIILSSIMGLLSILWVGSVWRISHLGVFQK